jgi:hypothetical protein
MAIKITELPEINSANLISSSVSVIPITADSPTLDTYKVRTTTLKTYIENGDFDATGNITATDVKFSTCTSPRLSLGTVSGSTVIDASASQFQTLVTNGNITLAFINWPITGNVREITLGINVISTTHNIINPIDVKTNANGITGYNPSTRVFTAPTPGVYSFSYLTTTGGTSITLSENNSVLRPFNSTSQTITASSDTIDLGTTYSVYNPSPISTAGNATLANGVVGQIKVISSMGSSTFDVNIASPSWKTGSGNIRFTGNTSSITLSWQSVLQDWIVLSSYGNVILS